MEDFEILLKDALGNFSKIFISFRNEISGLKKEFDIKESTLGKAEREI